MREAKSSDSKKQDESRRRGKSVEIQIDPRQLRAPSTVSIQDERWLESLLEEPERWDGMS